MASFKQYTASGGASEAFSIPSFTSDEIKVRVDGVLKTAGTGTTAGSSHDYEIQSYTVNGGTIAWVSGKVPSSGTVYIYRDTKILNNASSDVEGKATYGTGVIYKNDLNDNQKQVLRALQEKDDQLVQSWDLEADSVTNAKLADNSVDSDHYVDGSIDTVHIGNLQVTEAKIAADAVTQAKIADDAVGADQLASNSVVSASIVDGTIVAADIASNAITNAKLATDSVTTAKITDSSVTTNKIAAGAVTTGRMAVAAVTEEKLANDAVTQAKVADDAIGADQLASSAVVTASIVNDAITNAKIADDQIDSEHYVDGSIDTAHIGDAQVTHVKLANDCIDGDNIQNDVINSEHYVDGSIDSAHIANDAITNAHISNNAVSTNEINTAAVAAQHLAGGAVTTVALGPNAVTEAKLANDAVTVNKIADGSITSAKLNAATVVTASEQAAASANDTSFFTTSAADARYFNISTGDTIKDGDTFPDNDTTIATTAAINDRIIDLVDDVGGFVPIANETSFPTANPDVNNGAGTLVSIKALSSNLTSNGSGVATIANGAGSGNTVTINGLANSTTYAATFGMIVETTTTLHTYTFHRLVPKATEVTTVSGSIANVNTVAGSIANVNTVASDLNEGTSEIDTVATNITNVNNVGGSIANVNTVASNLSTVNDFAARYRVASSAPSSSLDTGDLYFDTTASELKVYNGTTWQGGVTASGNFATLGANQFTGNITFSGSQTVDGRDVSADGTKLDGIEASATADQTNAEIRTAVEAATDSNVFTDADHSKLNAIEASATADQTKSDIDALNINADTVDSLHAASFVRSDADDSFSGKLTSTYSSDEKIVLSGSNNPYIQWQEGSANKAYIQWSTSGHLSIYNNEDSSSLLIKDALTFSPDNSNFHVVWHAGNDGAGSGLDADTVDSLHAASFLRSDADDTSSGQLSLSYSSAYPLNINNTSDAKIVLQGSSNPYIRWREGTTDKSYIQWNASGFLEIYNQAAAKSFQIGSTLTFDSNTVWHAGNDGTGSGLDADTLDGVQGANFVRSDTSDTLSGASYTFSSTSNEKIVLQGCNNPHIRFRQQTTNKGYLGWNDGQGGFWLWNDERSSGLLTKDKPIWYSSSTYYDMVHQGNVGSGGVLSNSTVYVNDLYANDIYSSNWFKNTTSGEGLYNSANGNHFYSSSVGYWDLAYNGNSGGLRIVDGNNGAIRGYFYASDDNYVGILDNAGSWIIRGDSSSNTNFFGHAAPGSNNSYDLGYTGTRWKDGYFSGKVSDGKGYDLRSIPKNAISSNYNLGWSDAGKHLYCTNSPTITIPSGTFSEGDAITIINASTSDMTIARAANVNLYMPDGTDANCTLGKYGMATILHVNGVTDVFWISGSPLSQ